MRHPPLIAPSLMSIDFSNLRAQCEQLNQSAADMLHIDLTDGVYVPTLSLGYNLVRTVATLTTLSLDFHLMMIRPEEHLAICKRLGAQTISVQLDALQDVPHTLRAIKRLGCRAGLALHPYTSFQAVEPFLPSVDVLLLLSVLPGFGGQTFLPFMMEKIKQAKRHIASHKYSVQLCVDGGVTASLVPMLVAAGADILVAGHAVFGGGDLQENILHLKSPHGGS